MRVIHYSEVPAERVEEDAKGVWIRWVIREEDGAKNFVMRHFEIEPGGYTPHHTHPWEHEVFILGGSGVLVGEDSETEFGEGDVIFVPASEKHQFKNTGRGSLRLLCMIPSKDRCKL